MRRPQRVAVRVKVAERRRKLFGRGFLALATGALCAYAARRSELLGSARLRLEPVFWIEAVDASGVPEPARAEALALLERRRGRPAGPFEAQRLRKTLEERFGYLRDIRVRRSYLRRRLKASAALREAVARVLGSAGRPAWLDAQGMVFEAEEGLYRADLAEVRRPQGRVDWKALARFLRGTAEELDIARASRDPAGGWVFETVAGTRLRWGELTLTEEKLSRLREVKADAGARFEAVERIDLRFFEDGRIIVQPGTPARASR